MKSNFTLKINLRPHPKELLLEKKNWADNLVCFWDSLKQEIQEVEENRFKNVWNCSTDSWQKQEDFGGKVEVLYY